MSVHENPNFRGRIVKAKRTLTFLIGKKRVHNFSYKKRTKYDECRNPSLYVLKKNNPTFLKFDI